MSNVYRGCGELGDFAAASLPELHESLLDRFLATHDMPLHYAKPEIDNSPSSTIPLRIWPRPWRGSKRAYLRRRERGSL